MMEPYLKQKYCTLSQERLDHMTGDLFDPPGIPINYEIAF